MCLARSIAVRHDKSSRQNRPPRRQFIGQKGTDDGGGTGPVEWIPFDRAIGVHSTPLAPLASRVTKRVAFCIFYERNINYLSRHRKAHRAFYPVQIFLLKLSVDHGADLPFTSTPAHSSTTRVMEVKSEVGPYLAWVTASIWRTAAPATMGTPMASASSMQRRTSL